MPISLTPLAALMSTVVGTAVTVWYTWSNPVIAVGSKGSLTAPSGFYFEGKTSSDVMESTVRVKYHPGKVFYLEVYYTEEIENGPLAGPYSWTADHQLPDGSTETIESALLPGEDYLDASKRKPPYNVLTTIIPLDGSSLNEMNWFVDFADNELAWYCMKGPVPSLTGAADGIMTSHFKLPEGADCNASNGWEQFLVFDNDTLFFKFNIQKDYEAEGQPIVQLENFVMTQYSSDPNDFVPFYEDPSHEAYRTGDRVTATNPLTGATQLWTKDLALCDIDASSDFVEDPIDAAEQGQGPELQVQDDFTGPSNQIHKTDCRSWASVLGFYSHLVVYYKDNLPNGVVNFCIAGTGPGSPGSVFGPNEDFICSPSLEVDGSDNVQDVAAMLNIEADVNAQQNAQSISKDRALVCVHKKACPGSSTDPRLATYRQTPAWKPPACIQPSSILSSGDLLSEGSTVTPVDVPPMVCNDLSQVAFDGSQWVYDTCLISKLDEKPEMQNARIQWDDSVFQTHCGDRYIFFSGSDDIVDWLFNDIIGAFIPWPKYGTAWSLGMFSDFAQWKHLINRYMRPNGGSKTIFAGHSLGGGVASIAATFAKKQKPDLNVEIVTFGSPNVAIMPVIFIKYAIKMFLPALELPGLDQAMVDIGSWLVPRLQNLIGDVTIIWNWIAQTATPLINGAVPNGATGSIVDRLMAIVPVGKPFQDIPNKRYTNKSNGCFWFTLRDPIPLSTKPIGYLPGPNIIELYNSRRRKVAFSMHAKPTFPWVKIQFGCTPWVYSTRNYKTFPLVSDIGINLHIGGKYSTFANRARAQQGQQW